MRFRYVAAITLFSSSPKLMTGFIPKRYVAASIASTRNCNLASHYLFISFYPARDGFRSPVSAFSAALLISDA
jgi:hypothetical protein